LDSEGRLTDPSVFPDKRLVSIDDYINNHDGGLEAILNPPPADVPTGFPTLDAMFNGGFRRSEFIVIGARTSVGKSAFLAQLALNVARSGKNVGYCSLEMDYAQLLRRMICFIAGVSLRKFLLNGLDAEEKARCLDAVSTLRNLPLKIDERAELSAKTLRAVLKSAKPKLDLLIVDYLQLMVNGQNRTLEVSDTSRALRVMSKDFQLPILAAAQLNRNAEDSEEPKLSHLRESGSIEQDAQIVGLMFRAKEEEEKLSTEEFRAIDLAIPKNRDGVLGRLQFRFYGDKMMFVEAPRPDAVGFAPHAEEPEPQEAF
jgi:replicative DNA helicase